MDGVRVSCSRNAPGRRTAVALDNGPAFGLDNGPAFGLDNGPAFGLDNARTRA